jgi:hypothetical protein
MWELGAGLFHQSDDAMPPGAFSPATHARTRLFQKSSFGASGAAEFIFVRIRFARSCILIDFAARKNSRCERV